MHYNRIHPLYFLIGIATLLLVTQLRAASSVLIGQPFPVKELSPPEESEMEKHQGKVILYDFWASWCPPCKASFPAMQRLVDEFEEKGFTVIAINEDEKKDKMSRFLKRQKVTFPIAYDEGHKLIKSLNVKTMPSAFLVDRKGIIHSVYEGFYGKASEKKYREAIQSLLNSL